MRKILISIFLVMIGYVSYGQSGKELSLKEAVKYALANKAEAVKARLDLKKGELEVSDARSNALPKITANAGLTYNIKLQEMVMAGGFPGIPGPIRIKMGQDWNAMAGVSLQQMLFNQQVFTGLKAANTTREFYQINEQLTNEQVIEKVANAYYQVYQAKQTLDNINENLGLTRKTYEIIKGLNDVGLAKKIDLDRVQVAVTNLESTKQQIENGYELSKNALKFMVGMDMNEDVVLPENNFEVNYMIDMGNGDTTQRTEIKVLEKQKELLSLSRDAQKAGLYPMVYLTGNYNYIGMADKMPLFKGEKDQVYWSDMSSVGVNISIPLFTGFGTQSKIKKAELEIENLETNIKDVKLALNLEYKNAESNIKNSILTIESQKKNVKLAEEVLLNTQNNYKQGLSSLTDLLSAERELIDAKNSYTGAVVKYKMAEVAMMKAQGKLLDITK